MMLVGALVAGAAAIAGAGMARADNLPTITISDVTQLEGDAGTSAYVFVVALTQTSRVPVSVRASTRDGTASAGTDYVAGQAILNFAPGQLAQTFTVQVNGDQRYQGNRTFGV